MNEQAFSRSRRANIEPCDPVWVQVREEAEDAIAREPALAGFLSATILSNVSLEAALATRLAQLLESADLGAMYIRGLFDEAIAGDPDICRAVRADIVATRDRDPACTRLIEPLLYFKGFQAVQTYRIAHWLWTHGRNDLALFLQSRASKVFAVDIHPASRIGRGIFMDHATGVVIGATAVVEDDVSMLHGVTLGGTGKEQGDRHPKVRRGVLIGAGAKILGNIEVGACARVAAGSVVLQAVPPETTVAGVPARVVGAAGCAEPARQMDQSIFRPGRDTEGE
jgi:serine O-acetyltransferase